MGRERLENCFNTCAERAWRVALHWLGDAHEAFDVVQQAFVVAAAKPGAIPADDPWPWFRQVVINEARNARRKHKPTPSEQENAMPDPGPDPAAQATRNENAEHLRGALDTLPEAEREAIVLTQLNGLTHAEAAQALGMPVKTLSSHVSRGLERLRGRLGSKGETMLASLAAAPLAIPPGGWEGAMAAWKAAALATITEGAAGGVATGALLMKKSLAIAGMVVALGIGLGGGALITSSISDPPPRPEVSVTPTMDAGGEDADPLRMPNRERPAAGEDTAAELETARADGKKARDEADKLRARLKTLETERDTAVAEVDKLEAELAPIRLEQAERGPTFTFGKHGQIEGVTGSNWKELAAASHEVITTLRQIREKQVAGEPVPDELYIRLQQNTEIMRKYEYKTLKVLPSWAKHNGELTHPISHSNLVASELKLAGLPLTEQQRAQIEKLGLQWESDYEAAQKKYDANTPRCEKMADEYALKGVFVDAVWDVLSAEQRDYLVDSKWLHVAFVDLYCPTLMLIHTSPILTGADIGEIRAKLQDTLVKQYAIGEDQLPALSPLLDTWQSDVAEICGAVKKSDVRFYTFDQGLTAARATARLVKSIRDYVTITEDNRAKMLDAYDIYIPRVVTN
ncbi:MAG: sigma-70 family RNA polymerase sigma factor [Planctomycetes bacterium]|nr:sigma-70 family RNA polymerase sigma factor [Planctomycetota bacterium]